MKLRGCVLNTQTDRDGKEFSSECLKRIAEDTGVVPFSVSFSCVIGEALSFEYDEDTEQLLCDMVTSRADLDINGLFPAIGFLYGDNDRETIEIREVSLTSKPVSVGTWIREVENG